MSSLVLNSHGLGATPQTVDLSPDNIARCSSGWYYLNPFSCWGMSKDSWDAASGYKPANFAVAAPAAPPCAYSATEVCTAADGQAASDAAIVQTQANALAFFQSMPDAPGGTQPCEYFGLSCTTLAILAGGLVLAIWLVGGVAGGGPGIYARR
jgi:hypothetical protein